ncbi:hypothetical protein [Bifidobacterium jacchi]
MSNAGDDKGTYPVRVMAAASADFVMSGGSPGRAADYHVEQSIEGDLSSPGVLMIHPQSADTTLTITMSGTLRHPSADSAATKDRIVVTPVDGVPANVVLDGVRINLSGDTGIDAAAFSHTSGKLTLTLAKNSENELISGFNHAGLEKNDIDGKPSEAFALTITSEGSSKADWGSLTAQSYASVTDRVAYGAGIGGGKDSGSSHITVESGVIDARSYGVYPTGAGIGGGGNGDGSHIVISGGLVTAQSYGDASAYGAYGAGIGGGDGGDGVHIAVTGGTVTAQSYGEARYVHGAGIGGGDEGAGSDITISGGLVTAQSYSKDGEVYGAGIGGGYNAAGSAIKISGGTVVAQAYSVNNGVGGAGIGGGHSFDGDGSDIVISGGVVTAQSYSGVSAAFGAGIGGGNYGDGSNVVITGGSVKAIDGTYNGASTTPQPTDGKGNDVHLAVVPASAAQRMVRSCVASDDCADAGDAWRMDWKIDGAHVNADGSADANLYLWLPGTDDQFVQVSADKSYTSYTPYRAVYAGKNADGATNPWQWFSVASSSAYTLSIPKTTVSIDEDTTNSSATVTITNVKLVDPNRKLSIFGSVVNGKGDDWTSSDGLKLTRSDGNVTLRSIVTDDNGNPLGSASPLRNNISDGESTATLHFAKPTVDGSPTDIIPAGNYSANLTFTVREEVQQ